MSLDFGINLMVINLRDYNFILGIQLTWQVGHCFTAKREKELLYAISLPELCQLS